MDISEQYVKMSKQAWGKTHNHFDDQDNDNVYPHIFIDSDGNWWWREIDATYPLYRQDQLQAMIDWGKTSFCKDTFIRQKNLANGLINYLTQVIYDCGEEYLEQFKSWEQLWLAFVMKELYHKVWSGTDWIKEA